MKTTDSPGINFPPPLIYAVIFLAAIFIQKKIPIEDHFFNSRMMTDFRYPVLSFSPLFWYQEYESVYSVKKHHHSQ